MSSKIKSALFALVTILAFTHCATTNNSQESHSKNDSSIFGSRTEFEGRYRFKTRKLDEKSQFSGWWGELLITRDRMLRIYKSTDGTELLVSYGRVQTTAPQTIEYRVLNFSPTNLTSKYTDPLETYQVRLDSERSLTLQSSFRNMELIEEWIPVGIVP